MSVDRFLKTGSISILHAPESSGVFNADFPLLSKNCAVRGCCKETQDSCFLALSSLFFPETRFSLKLDVNWLGAPDAAGGGTILDGHMATTSKGNGTAAQDLGLILAVRKSGGDRTAPSCVPLCPPL